MSWHRLGVVSVANGSTTVTGVNTGFAANTRLGDAFIGPDGRQYELQNVASDTVISILPAYLGPTASGQSYAVMPIQGYQKLLADLVRDWTNSYGAKMAALGTTGNYDVLPVAKGGTGATDASTARAAFGLGSAATAALTASSTDTTAGRALKVGDFGLGSLAPLAIADFNSIPGGGQYRFATNAINGGEAAGFGTLTHNVYDNPSFNWTQLVVHTTGLKAFFRGCSNATLSPWREIYHTGNTTRGMNGALSAASPIVRIADVASSERRDLLEHTFEEAGPWGVGNDQARGVIVDRVAVGVYVITGSLGLALEGWRIHDPSSPDGGRMLGITESEQDDLGTVTVRLFKQRWTLDDDGEMHLGKGAPLDVPLNSWIDVRLEMPSVAETPPA